MDNKLYKEQMARMQPHDRSEFTWWENLKFTSMGAYILVLPALLLLVVVLLLIGVLR